MFKEVAVLGDEEISADPFGVRGNEGVSHFEASDFVFDTQVKRNEKVFINYGQIGNEFKKFPKGILR